MKFFPVFFLLFFLMSSSLHADCLVDCLTLEGCPPAAKGLDCKKEKEWCEKSCDEQQIQQAKQDEEDDVLFTGIKARQGNTTLMQGERIAAPLSAFQGGDLKPEDLEPFRKHAVTAANAHGSVSQSTSSSRKGWIFENSSSNTQNTNVSSGVTITAHSDE